MHDALDGPDSAASVHDADTATHNAGDGPGGPQPQATANEVDNVPTHDAPDGRGGPQAQATAPKPPDVQDAETAPVIKERSNAADVEGVRADTPAEFADGPPVVSDGGPDSTKQNPASVAPSSTLVQASALEEGVRNANAAYQGASRIGDGASDAAQFASDGAVVIDEWSERVDTVFEQLSKLCTFLENIPEIHPYVTIVTGVIEAGIQPFLKQKGRDDAVAILLEDLGDAYDLVVLHYPDTSSLKGSRFDLLIRFSQQIADCATFIQEIYAEKSFFKRSMKGVFKSIDKKIQDYSEALKKIANKIAQRDISDTKDLVTTISLAIHQSVEEVTLATFLHARDPHGLNKSKACLPGTRTGILDEIIKWICDPSTEACRAAFIIGGAGTGKSSVAHAIGLHFQGLRRLAAFVAFDRNFSKHCRPCSLLCTLAVCLAGWNSDFRKALRDVLERDPTLRNTDDIEQQWNFLIVEPVNAVTFVGAVVVIVDAFDESAADGRDRGVLLDFLTAHVYDLPCNVRIIVTARREEYIVGALRRAPAGTVDLFHLDSPDALDAVTRDIERYIRGRFSDLQPEMRLDDSQARELATKSEGLFQWAAIACNVLLHRTGGTTPRQTFSSPEFSSLIRTEGSSDVPKKDKSLDTLYKNVLSENFRKEDTGAMSRFRDVLKLVLYAVEPLSAAALTSLYCAVTRSERETAKTAVETVLRGLGSVLGGVYDDFPVVRILHSSFRDFLSSAASDNWFVESASGYAFTAIATLRVLNDSLRLNICEVKSSYRENPDFFTRPELLANLERRFPGLQYSARHWGDSLRVVPSLLRTDVQVHLCEFLYKRLLFWLELLSISYSLETAIPILCIAIQFLEDQEARNFTDDALRFVSQFSDVIGKRAPHIYLSALAFTPASSSMRSKFCSNISVPRIDPLRKTWWSRLGGVKMADEVSSIAYSPNGRYIAVGSRGIHIIDLELDKVIRTVHPEWSCDWHVSYSPDSRFIAFRSPGRTVSVWDAITGEIASLLPCDQAQSSELRLALFLRDGRLLVAGAEQSKAAFYLWTSKPIRAPSVCTDLELILALPYFEHKVRGLAYCYEGRYIVGDAETQICIWNWDEESNRAIDMRTFDPQAGEISCLACSPTSNRLALALSRTASRGSIPSVITLLILELDTLAIAGALNGHTSNVTCVSWSSDGRHIVSSSLDGSVRIWDADTCQSIGSPIYSGHWNCRANAAAFSPDGHFVVSAGCLPYLCLWNVEDAIRDPLLSDCPPLEDISYTSDGMSIEGRIPLRQSNWVFVLSRIRSWDVSNGAILGTSAPLAISDSEIYRITPFDLLSDAVPTVLRGRTIDLRRTTGVIRDWANKLFNTFKLRHRGALVFAFSMDGNRVAVWSEEQHLELWDLETRMRIGKPCAHTKPRGLAPSPTGSEVATLDDGNVIRVWQLDDSEDSEFAIPYFPLARRDPNRRDELESSDYFVRDGYIVDRQQNVILGLPWEYSHRLCYPGQRLMLNAVPVTIDLRNLTHGENWAEGFQHLNNL